MLLTLGGVLCGNVHPIRAAQARVVTGRLGQIEPGFAVREAANNSAAGQDVRYSIGGRQR
jgi:hypothetical protein